MNESAGARESERNITMIEQITVFLENKKGRLAALCRSLGDAGISMKALTVADTSSFGIVRILASAPEAALKVLNENGFRASLARVFAVEIPDRAGGLAELLEALDRAGINVEYAYCFIINGECAIDILKTDMPDAAETAIRDAGYRIVEPNELYG